jgi:hypothetical protein
MRTPPNPFHEGSDDLPAHRRRLVERFLRDADVAGVELEETADPYYGTVLHLLFNGRRLRVEYGEQRPAHHYYPGSPFIPRTLKLIDEAGNNVLIGEDGYPTNGVATMGGWFGRLKNPDLIIRNLRRFARLTTVLSLDTGTRHAPQTSKAPAL